MNWIGRPLQRGAEILRTDLGAGARPIPGGTREPPPPTWEDVMKKRLRTWIGITLVLTVATGLALPVPRAVFLGWLRGERFAHGRPASYWADRVRAGGLDYDSKAALVALGPDGVGPAAEALKHPDPEVRKDAAAVLGRIG